MLRDLDSWFLSTSTEVDVSELDSDLKRDDFSERLEAMANELLRVLTNPFCLAMLAVDDIESDNDLNHEVFSVRAVDGPIEALRLTVRPLKNELTKLNELLSPLNSDVC